MPLGHLVVLSVLQDMLSRQISHSAPGQVSTSQLAPKMWPQGGVSVGVVMGVNGYPWQSMISRNALLGCDMTEHHPSGEPLATFLAMLRQVCVAGTFLKA